MSDNNPSFETAPLKTKYIVDLDEFNEAIDSAEDKFKALAEAIQDITIKLNIASNVEEIRQAIQDIPYEKTIKIDLEDTNQSINLNAVNEEITDADASVNQYNKSLNKLEDQLETLQTKAIRTMRDLNLDSDGGIIKTVDKLTDLSTKLDKLMRSSSQLNAEMKVSDDELNEFVSKALDLQNIILDDVDKVQNGAFEELQNELTSLDEKLSDINSVDGYEKALSDLADQLDNTTRSMQRLKAAGVIDDDTSEAISEQADTLNTRIKRMSDSMSTFNADLADNADEIERTSSAYGEFMSKLAGLQIGLERLQEEDKLNGDINIRGVREAQEQISALKEQLSDLNVAMQESHEDGNLSDEAFESLGDSTSRTAQEMNDFNNHLNDTVTGFVDSVRPIHESGLNLKEYGEKMEESGQMALWNGMMINSMLSPIREVGEKCFSLGLTSKTAMEIAGHAFGSNTKSVETWANNATRNFGITTGAALDSAEKFGFASKTMGANAKESASLGEEYTGLAAHIMLTSNGTMSFSQAQQMAMAVMQGQTYQTKRLGISFSNTALNAEALKLGFNKQFSALTPLQQATVRCHLAQIDLNKAYGTTNSLLGTAQGQWTQTKAKLESTGEVIGERLLPIVLKCARGVEKLANWFDHLSAKEQDAILIFAGVVSAIGPVIMVVGLLKMGLGLAAKAIEGVGTAFSLLGDLLEACPIVAIITAIIGVCALLYEAWKHNWFGLRTVTNDVVHDIANYVDWAKGHIGQAIEDILKIILGIADPVIGVTELIKLGWDKNFLGMRTKTLAICNDIKQDFEKFGTDVENTFDRLGTDIENILDSIGRDISSSFNAILSTIEHILNNIGTTFEDDWNDIRHIADDALNAIENAISSHFDNMISDVTSFGSDFVNGFESMCSSAKSAFEDGISAVQSVWDSFTSWFSGVVSEPVNAIENIAGDMESAGSNIISSLWDGAESEWNGFINWITGGLNRVANWVSNETSHLLHDLDSVDGSHATGLSYVPWDGQDGLAA